MPSPRAGNFFEARPYQYGVAITPSDVTDLSESGIVAIYVGVTGNIVIEGMDGSDYTLIGAIAGTILPVVPSKVNSTSTTATNLIGLKF